MPILGVHNSNLKGQTQVLLWTEGEQAQRIQKAEHCSTFNPFQKSCAWKKHPSKAEVPVPLA